MKYSYLYLKNEWERCYSDFCEFYLITFRQHFSSRSKNPNIKWKDILRPGSKFWNWKFLSSNPAMTWEIIQNNPDINWNWFWLSYNPNLTWEILQNNLNKNWNWYLISSNTMEKGKEKWINDLRLKTIKVLQIQRHWRNCTSNPVYKLTQKLIQIAFKKS